MYLYKARTVVAFCVAMSVGGLFAWLVQPSEDVLFVVMVSLGILVTFSDPVGFGWREDPAARERRLKAAGN